MFVDEQPLPWVPEAIRLFIIAEAMEWNHLPVAGGIYDQDPRLFEAWLPIWQRRAAKERAKNPKPTT